jgi:purine-nucleoside phosphorylase
MPTHPHPSVTPAVNRLRRTLPFSPRLGLVLGSGFDAVVESIEHAGSIPYTKLPGFPKTQVRGHRGSLVWGQLEGVSIVALAGRAHFYEGHELGSVTFPVRVLAALGVRVLVLTNAAGGLDPRYRPGDLMLLRDHINFMGANPLRGTLTRQGPPFIDMTQAYDPALRACMSTAARACRLRLREGVYLAVSGPCYETPAEVRAFRRLGANAVGMSTVPEVIVARACGMRVVALSCIANLAAGMSSERLSHAEVLTATHAAGPAAARLLRAFAKGIASDLGAGEPAS